MSASIDPGGGPRYAFVRAGRRQLLPPLRTVTVELESAVRFPALYVLSCALQFNPLPSNSSTPGLMTRRNSSFVGGNTKEEAFPPARRPTFTAKIV